jgi:hypothetical protein
MSFVTDPEVKAALERVLQEYGDGEYVVRVMKKVINSPQRLSVCERTITVNQEEGATP